MAKKSTTGIFGLCFVKRGWEGGRVVVGCLVLALASYNLVS